MKVCGQQFIAIFKKFFSNEDATTAKVVKTPTEGKRFEVNYEIIDRSFFEKNRLDRRQEQTRKLILKAFDEVEKNPEKYATSFYTFIPKKEWNDYKKVKELKNYAKDLGGHMADWVEQALEWAQRICNGESWEAVCNDADTANWNRLVVWNNGYCQTVGGSVKDDHVYPASTLLYSPYSDEVMICKTVPLVVLKKS